ncbi:hypothetical protein CXB51_016853 [Gossypium anomalum]|uniref:DUF7745 domain-containing protein n=1 Tax=Gossypium anomalum TaxID=47600 RepID=A0A8J6CZ42_9ROSI|nr:hypothetical protein CXB51_016853 [Gossypium anomalum]
MTVVVTPLSESEKLRFREVFASVQNNGSLSGYTLTYGFIEESAGSGIDSRSVSKLGSFVMENGLLDRVEGNADVHRWSEQTQQEKRDSIIMGYVSDLDLPYLPDIQVNEHLFRALAQFWNPAYSCFTFREVDLVPTVEEYTALLQCPRFQCDRIYSRATCVPTFAKKLMTITGMSEQWIMARIKEKGESKCIPWGALKDLIQTHPDEAKRVDIFALSLYGLMVFPKALGYVDEATTDLFHRLSKQVTSVLAILTKTFRSLNACRRASTDRFVGCAQLLLAWFYSHFRLIDRVVCRVFFEDYSLLKDIAASTRRVDVPEKNWIVLLQNLQSKDVEWRAPYEILYRCGSFDWVPLLGIWGAIGYASLLVLRQHGLRSSYRQFTGWFRGVAISPATTPEYVEWTGRRINDNIPKPSVEGARLMEEYLQVTPSELEIMKQVFERKNLELEKRIAMFEEEKIYLSLDVDVQKMEVKKRTGIGGSSNQLQKEVRGEKSKAEYWERKVTELGRSLHLQRSPDSTVEGELRQSKEQVRDRGYLIGEAIIQIREVAEHVRDLEVRADVLSMMHESSSDIGRELALLLDRVKTLGIRAKAYL